MKSGVYAAVALAGASLALVGCMAERVTGLRPPQPQGTPLQGASPPPACAFSIKSIDDRREDKSLGVLIRTKVDGDGFSSWFADGMAAIPGQTTPESATISVQIEVLKAYIHAIGTMKSANLVVRVTAVDAAGSRHQSTFRGVDGSVNWNNSQDEVQVAFNAALADLQRQIGADLNKHCNR